MLTFNIYNTVELYFLTCRLISGLCLFLFLKSHVYFSSPEEVVLDLIVLSQVFKIPANIGFIGEIICPLKSGVL